MVMPRRSPPRSSTPRQTSGRNGCRCGSDQARTARSEPGGALFADAERSGEDANAPHGLWPTLTWIFSLFVLNRDFPLGILRSFLDLPWPFR